VCNNFVCSLFSDVFIPLLAVILNQTETQAYVMRDKQFILVIKFILNFFVTSFFGKWIFLVVFLRHTEFLSDPAWIVLNLTTPLVMPLIFGNVTFIFSYTRQLPYHSDTSTFVFIFVRTVTKLISVHFVTNVSAKKKKFALLSTGNFMGQFWQYRRKLATVAPYAL